MRLLFRPCSHFSTFVLDLFFIFQRLAKEILMNTQICKRISTEAQVDRPRIPEKRPVVGLRGVDRGRRKGLV